MTDWYAPNQQAVGIEPAASGAPEKAKKASKGVEPTESADRPSESPTPSPSTVWEGVDPRAEPEKRRSRKG
jgi:hypothetical protein